MKKILLIICAVFMLTAPVIAQEDDCFEKGGMWDASQQQCVVQGSLEINIDYPLSVMQYDFVEQTVDEFIQQRKTEFIQFFSEGGFFPGVPAPWGLWIEYEEYQFSDTVISLSFTISDYTGGAHPNSYFQTFTFDLAENRVIAFDELFVEGSDPLSTIYPIVQQKLTELIGDYSDPQWIETGSGENLANYQSFVLTENSLIILFPPYQVAAYAAGPQQVEIPLADLNAILKPEFVPSG